MGFVFGFERFERFVYDFDFGVEVRGLLRMVLQVEMMGMNEN